MDNFVRLQALRQQMEQNHMKLCVMSSPENIQYFSGFQAITYSRPILFVVSLHTTHLVIPALEEAHAQLSSTEVKHLHVYYEHPEKFALGGNPFQVLQGIMSQKNPVKVGIEFNAMSLCNARQLEGWGCELIDIGPTVSQMRYIKDETEQQYIREAGRLCKLAFEESLRYARCGISEMEFEQYGTTALYESISNDYPYSFGSPGCITPSGPERTVMPHVYSGTRRFRDGDMVIHVRKPSVNGYLGELERTFFIGKPSEAATRAFTAMLEAQTAVIEAIRPGVTAQEMDRLGRDVLRKYGYEEYAIHRIGHGQGLGRHEEPFLIFNSQLELREGMVFTVEPGIYIPGVGGFRHSDTLIITRNGCENTTDFRRQLVEMTFAD